ncbi:MAG: hypothetical protein MI741_09845, partial [Rhodospirillales bacterium]|nr:hypothetical protein [Rhodospirillales bacterium]
LLMSYQPTRFRLASEKGGKLAAFDSCSGKKLWQHDNANYKSRPVLIDRTIYTQGGAWDLIDGSGKDFKLGDRSYGCGILSAGRNLIAYRSATLGYCDLTEGDKVRNFGGLRVGCWINSLPAGGMLLIPDGSAGCRCAYQNQTWIALQTDPTKGE